MRASRANVAGLHDTATIDRNATRGKFARLRLRALARRIEHDGVETVELGRDQRILEQVAALRRHGLEPGRSSAARLSAASAASSSSTARTRAFSASRSANGPTPANRSATLLAPAQVASTSRASTASPSAVACRKAAGGRRHGRRADAQRRRARLRDQFAMARQPREVVLRGDARQRRGQARRSAAPSRARRCRGRHRSR